jgi:hypothetical protein
MLPVLVGGGLIAAGVWLRQQWSREDADIARTFARTIQRPPAPAAPQTQHEMRTWTPEHLALRDRDQWRTYQQTVFADVPAIGPTNDQYTHWLLIGGAALAAVALLR